MFHEIAKVPLLFSLPCKIVYSLSSSFKVLEKKFSNNVMKSRDSNHTTAGLKSNLVGFDCHE